MSAEFKKPEIGHDSISRAIKIIAIVFVLFLGITLLAYLISKGQEETTKAEQNIPEECRTRIPNQTIFKDRTTTIYFPPPCPMIFQWNGYVDIWIETLNGTLYFERMDDSEIASMAQSWCPYTVEEMRKDSQKMRNCVPVTGKLELRKSPSPGSAMSITIIPYWSVKQN